MTEQQFAKIMEVLRKIEANTRPAQAARYSAVATTAAAPAMCAKCGKPLPIEVSPGGYDVMCWSCYAETSTAYRPSR